MALRHQSLPQAVALFSVGSLKLADIAQLAPFRMRPPNQLGSQLTYTMAFCHVQEDEIWDIAKLYFAASVVIILLGFITSSF